MSYRIAVLVSGSGSNLQALIDACADRRIAGEIVLVASDRADAYGLQRALHAGLAVAFVPLTQPRKRQVRLAWEVQLADLINLFRPDLLVLSGFMRVLSAAFLERCHAVAINQHPALLPADGGPTVTTSTGVVIPALRGAHVVPDALAQGLAISGCTIHRVTPAVDDGPILAQAEVPIFADDTEASLHERIKAEERRLIVEVVARLAGEHAAQQAG
jgi:phosphoribosylglycinamide formyltransferase-1